jgi:hypothetical protein
MTQHFFTHYAISSYSIICSFFKPKPMADSKCINSTDAFHDMQQN